MKLITAATKALTVPQRWTEQYGSLPSNPEHKKIGEQLNALSPSKRTPSRIKGIIGNDSWTTIPRCSECKERKDEVLQIGEEPDYESETAYLCLACLDAANKLFTKAPQG